MITVLKQIKGHNKVESLQIMLQVIEILEKNFSHDDRMKNEEWEIVTKWLIKYYRELNELFIKRKGY